MPHVRELQPPSLRIETRLQELSQLTLRNVRSHLPAWISAYQVGGRALLLRLLAVLVQKCKFGGQFGARSPASHCQDDYRQNDHGADNKKDPPTHTSVVNPAHYSAARQQCSHVSTETRALRWLKQRKAASVPAAFPVFVVGLGYCFFPAPRFLARAFSIVPARASPRIVETVARISPESPSTSRQNGIPATSY